MNQFDLRQALHDYYQAERAAGWAAALGLVLLAFAAWLCWAPGFRRGLGAALALGGALMGIGGGFYFLSLGELERSARSRLDVDPPAFKRDELARLEGVAARFQLIRAVDFAVGAAGLALVLGNKKRPVRVGFGLGLLVQGAGLWLLEGNNAERASHYQTAVASFLAQPRLPRSPDLFRDFPAFYDRLRAAFRADDLDFVAHAIEYPLALRDVTLKGAGDLNHHFDEIFPPERRFAIEAGTTEPSDDPSVLIRGGLELTRRCEPGAPGVCRVRVTGIRGAMAPPSPQKSAPRGAEPGEK